MSKHIGIVAGWGWGDGLFFCPLFPGGARCMGGDNYPEITMNSMPMADQMDNIRANDWEAVAEILAASANKIAKAGADFAICPDNTYHQAFKYLLPMSPIPWLHIAEAVG